MPLFSYHTTQKGLAMPKLPGRKQFMALLDGHMSEDEALRVRCAYVLAKVAHQGQLRDSGERYFDHPKAVALILIDLGVYDWEMLALALDHDAVEDTDLRDSELYRLLFGDWFVEALMTLSKNQTPDYMAGLWAADGRVLMVKLADRLHNVTTLYGVTPEKRLRKLTETQREYLPLLDHLHDIVSNEYKAAAKELDNQLRQALAAA